VNEPANISEGTSELLDTYLSTAERWHALQSDADAANKANKVFDENHAVYKLLRGSDEGCSGIAQLMAHQRIGVRLLAATHSLAWAPDEAIAVLEAIEKSGGLHAVTAKYTLRSYRSGKLNLDW
jgi:hypothetical protein